MTGFVQALTGGGQRARPLLPSFFEPFDTPPAAEPDAAADWREPSRSAAQQERPRSGVRLVQTDPEATDDRSEPRSPVSTPPPTVTQQTAVLEHAVRPTLRVVQSPASPRSSAVDDGDGVFDREADGAGDGDSVFEQSLPAPRERFAANPAGPRVIAPTRRGEPHVTVSIGRIEVRAASPASEPAPRPRPERKPAVDLGDYLRGGASR